METYKSKIEFFEAMAEYLSERLGNNGCNDCYLEDTKENVQLIKQYNEFNNPNKEPGQDLSIEPNSRGELYIPDFCLWPLVSKQALEALRKS